MKVFLVIAALVAVAAAEVSLHAVFQAKWNRFKAAHGKNYHRDEEPQRIQAFLENVHHVETHNEKFHKGQETYELAHNEFADMPHEEFKAKMLGFRMPEGFRAERNRTVFQYNPNLEMPSATDWRSYAPLVKNQGQCGSCYSFSALGALEGALARKFGGRYDLSEQNVVDCSTPHGNYGCNGGFMTAVFKYVRQNGGVNHGSTYPYEGRVGSCRYNSRQRSERISSYAEIPYANENALQQALATVGPIAVAVDANPRSFMLYSRGIYDDAACTTRLTHAVLAVGYGSENGIPYYLIKNSWGTGWGEGGYFKLRAGVNRCGVANMASYPIL